jgi:archaeal type IV pilus assembly protein PilA
MNYMRKIKKSTKALSPVVASIILIAVTVAVSVVVAAWMGGMTIGLMGNAEQVSVTNYAFPTGASVVLNVRNTGTATVTLSSAAIDGNAVTMAPVTGTSLNIGKGETGNFTLTLASPNTFNAGAQYSIKLVTAKGTTIPYTITYNP